jgi:hypothetical protein
MLCAAVSRRQRAPLVPVGNNMISLSEIHEKLRAPLSRDASVGFDHLEAFDKLLSTYRAALKAKLKNDNLRHDGIVSNQTVLPIPEVSEVSATMDHIGLNRGLFTYNFATVDKHAVDGSSHHVAIETVASQLPNHEHDVHIDWLMSLDDGWRVLGRPLQGICPEVGGPHINLRDADISLVRQRQIQHFHSLVRWGRVDLLAQILKKFPHMVGEQDAVRNIVLIS